MAKLVYNIEPASPSMISSLDRHCLHREPDGSSNIDKARSHLNRILIGDKKGLSQSLKNFYAGGVKRPTSQAESPYLRIVLSASPDYFRPDDPEAVGTWDEDRLAAWIEASMNQLREEHGADLVFTELHLDEDTPHIHAVVAPTYQRKPRKPGKPKRGETAVEFEARKALALASEGVRTVGRASHATLSKMGSFQRLRERMTVAVDHLGIEYGEDRAVDAPPGISTRQWVKNEAARLREEAAQLQQEKLHLEQDRAQLESEERDISAEWSALSASHEQHAYERSTLDEQELSIAQERAALKGSQKQLEDGSQQLEAAQRDLASDKVQIEQDRKQLVVEKAEVEKMTGRVEHGVNNLQVAIDRVQAGTYDKEVSLQDMPNQPKAFATLKAAAPDNHPTAGFVAGFWALNHAKSGKPVPLPEKIRASLTKAFDRVADWADEVRRGRLEAQNALTEAQRAATAAAEGIVASAEGQSAQILQQARERGKKSASLDDRVRGWAALTELIREKVMLHFGEAGYQEVDDSVNEVWDTHPDNPDLPDQNVEPDDSGPSGP